MLYPINRPRQQAKFIVVSDDHIASLYGFKIDLSRLPVVFPARSICPCSPMHSFAVLGSRSFSPRNFFPLSTDALTSIALLFDIVFSCYHTLKHPA